MTDAVRHLIDRYRPHGLLVDTNVLLLYFVGSFRREQVPRFKRAAQFAVGDYDLLARLLAGFKKIVTTPNVLSEVNSLSGQMGEPDRTKYFEQFARGIGTLDEHYVASEHTARIDEFPRLGLTNSGIMRLAKNSYLVLTDDLKLSRFLDRAGIDVLNFNHLRFLTYTHGR